MKDTHPTSNLRHDFETGPEFGIPRLDEKELGKERHGKDL